MTANLEKKDVEFWWECPEYGSFFCAGDVSAECVDGEITFVKFHNIEVTKVEQWYVEDHPSIPEVSKDIQERVDWLPTGRFGTELIEMAQLEPSDFTYED